MNSLSFIAESSTRSFYSRYYIRKPVFPDHKLVACKTIPPAMPFNQGITTVSVMFLRQCLVLSASAFYLTGAVPVFVQDRCNIIQS